MRDHEYYVWLHDKLEPADQPCIKLVSDGYADFVRLFPDPDLVLQTSELLERWLEDQETFGYESSTVE